MATPRAGRAREEGNAKWRRRSGPPRERRPRDQGGQGPGQLGIGRTHSPKSGKPLRSPSAFSRFRWGQGNGRRGPEARGNRRATAGPSASRGRRARARRGVTAGRPTSSRPAAPMETRSEVGGTALMARRPRSGVRQERAPRLANRAGRRGPRPWLMRIIPDRVTGDRLRGTRRQGCSFAFIWPVRAGEQPLVIHGAQPRRAARDAPRGEASTSPPCLRGKATKPQPYRSIGRHLARGLRDVLQTADGAAWPNTNQERLLARIGLHHQLPPSIRRVGFGEPVGTQAEKPFAFPAPARRGGPGTAGSGRAGARPGRLAPPGWRPSAQRPTCPDSRQTAFPAASRRRPSRGPRGGRSESVRRSAWWSSRAPTGALLSGAASWPSVHLL